MFVYAFDTDAAKKIKANQLIRAALLDNRGCISYQVIQEFVNVATKKFLQPLSVEDCQKFVDKVLSPLCHVFANIELYHRGLDIVQRQGYSFYDSLIIAAAIQADCTILYLKDLQHGQRIATLKIEDPFL